MSSQGLWTEKIAYDGSGRIQYIGKAPAGTEENESLWSIYELTYEGTSHRIASKLWAGGDSSLKWRWDLRATYTYS